MNATPTTPRSTDDAASGDRLGETSATAPASAAKRRGGLRQLAPWLLAIVLATVAAVAAYGWQQATSDRSADDEITSVAGRAVTTLTTWDASDLGPVEAAVADFGTGRFQDEAQGIFAEFSAGLEQARVVSEGEVLELAIAETGQERAVALATVRQQVTNTSTEQGPIASCWGARVTLARVDGRWLVDQLQLFGPNACEQSPSDAP